MFCTNLRRRPSYVSVLPLLTSTDGLNLRENRLETHDLAISLAASINHNTNGNGGTTTTCQLRVLLLSPRSASEANLTDTLDRIHHFAALTGGQDLAIVFLLSPPKDTRFNSAATFTSVNNEPEVTTKGVLAHAALQASLLPRTDIPHIPILPLATLENLPSLLKSYSTALSRKQHAMPVVASPFELLQLSTTEPPVDRQTAFFATDCFSNLREMAVACTETEAGMTTTSSSPEFGNVPTTQSGLTRQYDGRSGSLARERMRQLRGLVGEERYGEIVDFWADEWVVE